MFNCTHGRNSKELLSIISDIQSHVGFDQVIFTTNITYRKGYSSGKKFIFYTISYTNNINQDNTDRTVSKDSLLSLQSDLVNNWLEHNPNFSKQKIHCLGTIEESVEHAIGVSANKKVQVLVTGSLIMVGNTLAVLGIEPQ